MRRMVAVAAALVIAVALLALTCWVLSEDTTPYDDTNTDITIEYGGTQLP